MERNGTFALPETHKSIDNLLARDVKFICMKAVTSTWSERINALQTEHHVGQICPDLFR